MATSLSLAPISLGNVTPAVPSLSLAPVATPISPVRSTPLVINQPVNATPVQITPVQPARMSPLPIPPVAPVVPVVPVVLPPASLIVGSAPSSARFSPLPITNVAAPPTETELRALGFHSLEMMSVNVNGHTENYVVAFSKNGHKVMILIDSPMNLSFVPVEYRVITPVEPQIPAQYQRTCQMCRGDYIQGLAYRRDGTMCYLRPSAAEAEAVSPQWFGQAANVPDPAGIFKCDTLPFPVVRLSDVRRYGDSIHCALSKFSDDIFRSHLQHNINEIELDIARADALKHSLVNYLATLRHQTSRTCSSLAQLRSIDAQYQRIKPCDIPADQAEALISARGRVFDNTAYNLVKRGCLVSNSSNVTRIADHLIGLTETTNQYTANLNANFANIDKPISIAEQ